ncbi:uncharacterized protein LOC142923220 isoform X2 [Petromyzon marinus]|uniref:uncharacterized protein LOC142923220 isoform X2 n=1 Tax=Petromyzon marinus TaxID=7757 RepID=UPI003F72C54D
MTSRRNPTGLTMGVKLLLMISLLHKLSLAKECGDGFYKSQRGICCELCPAGTYKMFDCAANKRRARCNLCPEDSFMSRVNHEEKCAPCSSCGQDEEVAHTCSVAQDTVCQCIQGLKRDPGSGICLHEKPHTAAIVLGSILGLVLSAFSLFILKKKRKWLTLKKTSEHYGTTYRKNNDKGEELAALVFIEVQGSQKSETMKLIRENQDNLKAWIGVDPSHLLEHLKDYEWIPHHVYNAARKRHGEECVEHILNHFLKKGDTGCKELWEALFFVRKHYLQLWRWLHNRGDAMQCIRENKSALKLWISRDPHHLLEHLKSQTFISNAVLAKAKGMNGGEKCAELLLNYFINRGNDDCLQLLISLQAVQDEYPEVKQWLGSLGTTYRKNNDKGEELAALVFIEVQGSQKSETMKLIRENQDNLKAWIGVDPSHLLEHLKDYEWIPHHVYNAARKRHGEECVEHILNHFLKKGDTGCKELWEALFFVRKHYLQLWRWLHNRGDAMQCIRENKSALKLWISRDPHHLLEHLKSQTFISNAIFAKAKGMNGGEKCAELLLNYFINRGNDDCLQLLISLQAVQDEYPEVKQWLGSLGSTKTKSNGISVPRVDVLSNGIQSDTLKLIQENKGNFREWIGVDTSHLLKFFDESHSIPHEVCQAAKNKHGEECVDVILDHFFNQEETALWELWKGLYYVRRNYEPLKSWFQKHGESVRSIKEKKLDLKLWIAKDPRHLLLQLTSRGQIPNKIFTQAKGMNNVEKSAEALLNYFISRGNDDCLQLLFALQAVQDKYPEVTQWLGSLVFFKRLCKKTSLFLNKYTNSSLQEKIRSYKRELIQALHSNVIPLLSQLQSQNIFTDFNVQEAKEREQWQGSEKATEYVLELVCVKRHVKQFWMVLWNLRETYPQLKDIFEQF